MTVSKDSPIQSFFIETQGREELRDITADIAQCVKDSAIPNGVCMVFVPHTTAGVTINENADPTVRQDMLLALNSFVLDSLPYRHAEGNSPAHVKASLMGSSVQILIQEGRLVLGTWQGIYFCEFAGPRTRRFKVYCRG